FWTSWRLQRSWRARVRRLMGVSSSGVSGVAMVAGEVRLFMDGRSLVFWTGWTEEMGRMGGMGRMSGGAMMGARAPGWWLGAGERWGLGVGVRWGWVVLESGGGGWLGGGWAGCKGVRWRRDRADQTDLGGGGRIGRSSGMAVARGWAGG